MTRLRVACVQMRSGTEPGPNLAAATGLIREAAGQGATLIATPEMTNILDIRPGGSAGKIVPEDADETLKAFRSLAKETGAWLLAGSLAVALEDDARKANRSFLVSPAGEIAARYDKVHMFDVEVGDGQSYRESKAYRPGTRAVMADIAGAKLGLTICYDVRFPAIYRALALAGAEIITVPSAFTAVTGRAHWHVLLRARAIETGAFMLAPAQGGLHEDGRETYGHSLIVSPWGEIIAELEGTEPGLLVADIDLSEVADARRRIPSLSGARDFEGPVWARQNVSRSGLAIRGRDAL